MCVCEDKWMRENSGSHIEIVKQCMCRLHKIYVYMLVLWLLLSVVVRVRTRAFFGINCVVRCVLIKFFQLDDVCDE